MRHNLNSSVLFYPVFLMLSLPYTITDLLVNRILQSLLQKTPIPKRLCRKLCIMCPNIPGGIPWSSHSQLASDTWGLYLHTHIWGACAFILDTKTSGKKYHPLAPESIISVSLSSKMSFFFSFMAVLFANFCYHFLEILSNLHIPSDDNNNWDKGIL